MPALDPGWPLIAHDGGTKQNRNYKRKKTTIKNAFIKQIVQNESTTTPEAYSISRMGHDRSASRTFFNKIDSPTEGISRKRVIDQEAKKNKNLA